MIEKLKKLGLNKYDANVYLTLLKNDSMTGTQIYKKSSVPHGKTYESLSKLESIGLIQVYNIKPKLFKAAKPQTTIRKLIQQRKDNLEELQEDIFSDINGLNKAHRKKVTEERIIIVKGRKNTIPLIEAEYANTKKYLKVMLTFELKTYAEIRAMKEALQRGVRIKYIATKISKNGLKWMKENIEAGAEVRYYPVQEIRISIKDGEQGRISIVNPDDLMDRTIIYYESKELAKGLELYFDNLWKKAKKIT